MTRRAALALALILGLSLVATSPVAADDPLRGWMDSNFNAAGFGDATTPCPHVTWVGTIDIDGDLYAMSFEPTGPLQFIGSSVFFHEIWRIHELGAIEFSNGLVTKCAGDGLMWGIDRGVVTANDAASAEGTVLYVDPTGPFDTSLLDARTSWSGFISGGGVVFGGTMRIS